MSRVAVIGTGYVGLATSVALAHLGHQVVGADVDEAKVQSLGQGKPTILEDGLEVLLRDGLESGRLRFVVGAQAAVKDAEFVFLCVGTPQAADGSADTSALEAVAREIGPHLAPGAVVVNKSTVPVGSSHLVEQLLGRPGVAVVSNPEFLREGSAVQDALNPDRVIVGASDPAAAARVGALFAGTRAPLIVTDAATAETIKYASNCFLATKLSFVNELANLCDAVGADVRDVLLGMGYDHRIGFDFMRPGPGWGGSCFPKDTRALEQISRAAGYRFELLEAAISANERQLESVVTKILAALGSSGAEPAKADDRREPTGSALVRPTVAVWGLTFKANTDDRRDSPAIEVVRRLLVGGVDVRAYDPTVSDDVPELAGVGTGELSVHLDPLQACQDADALAVLTEWEQLRWLDFEKVRATLRKAAVVDARNLLDPAAMRRMGFEYVAMGRP